MDQQALIEEIVARVTAKLSAIDVSQDETKTIDDRPGLLILTQNHSDACHRFYESGPLGKRYRIGCALLENYDIDLDAYDTVILFDLSNEALSKLASGIFDSPYTKLAGQAILTGKRIYIAAEQIELYHYEKTAPKTYYTMMQQKLAFLCEAGLMICRMSDLENCILGTRGGSAIDSAQPHSDPLAENHRAEYRLDKRVITERDVAHACTEKASYVYIPAKSIVTDLAKDYARSQGISLIRG